jgi:hypothetical protein
MELHDLQYLPALPWPAARTVYRIQRIRNRPGTLTVGALKLAPLGDQSGRFALPDQATGYFAESPETAAYESLVRREAVSLSLTQARQRQLLCLQTTAPLHLLDLRQHASTWPVLQSLRFSVTRQLAAGARTAGFDGIAYRSAQHHGQDCFVVFGPGLQYFKPVWRRPLIRPDGAMHQALAAAIRGGQIPLVS